MNEAPDLRSVAERLLLLKEASQSFLGFVRAVRPGYKLAPFQLELIDTLDKLERGTLGKRNLLITMPPRHGKSWIASTLFPAYYMCRNATRKILAVSYGYDLAQTFGRQVRDICREPVINQAFPDFDLSSESRAVDDWMTTEGGKYYATGVGGGTTGRPANLLLIDDPIKNRTEAESAANRNKAWSFYNSSLNNRKEPEFDGTPPIEVLIQTRWHPDDLAGRIMDSDDWRDGDWHHIDFPAIRTESTVDPTTETITQTELALWPERFPLETLHKMQRRDPREFAALYQQQPYVQGGNLIKAGWFGLYSKDTKPDSFQSVIITVDTAFTTGTRSDYSVMMTLGLTHDGNIYLLNVERDKLDYPALKRRLLIVNSQWRGHGLKGIYVEASHVGSTMIQDLRSTPGLSIIPYGIHGKKGATDKVSRASAVLPLIEGGRVYIPEEAPWLDPFLEEIQGFPTSTHDDQVDCLSMGLDILSRVTLSTDAFSHMPDLGQSLNALSKNANSLSWAKPISRDQDMGTVSAAWSTFKPLGEL